MNYSHWVNIVLFSVWLLVLIVPNTYGQYKEIAPVDLSNVSDTKKKEVISLAKKILEGMDNEQYYTLNSAEAREELIDNFTPENQAKFYNSKTEGMGSYAGNLTIAEVYDVSLDSGNEMVFYRLKANFFHEKTLNRMEGEVRMMYYKDDTRLAGFAMGPWLTLENLFSSSK